MQNTGWVLTRPIIIHFTIFNFPLKKNERQPNDNITKPIKT